MTTDRPKQWWDADPDGLFPHRQTTVYEQEPDRRPVLYGPRGEPLVRPPKPPVGFRPPTEKR